VVTASKTIESVIEQAQLDARRFNCPVVDTEHILLSALQSAGPMLQSAFERFGVSIEAAIVRAEAIINDVAMGRILPEK
jgi:ATP-dependent Clp protease ATP-binding subunit ClpA